MWRGRAAGRPRPEHTHPGPVVLGENNPMGIQVEAQLDDSDLPLFLKFFLFPERWVRRRVSGERLYHTLGTCPCRGVFLQVKENCGERIR